MLFSWGFPFVHSATCNATCPSIHRLWCSRSLYNGYIVLHHCSVSPGSNMQAIVQQMTVHYCTHLYVVNPWRRQQRVTHTLKHSGERHFRCHDFTCKSHHGAATLPCPDLHIATHRHSVLSQTSAVNNDVSVVDHVTCTCLLYTTSCALGTLYITSRVHV